MKTVEKYLNYTIVDDSNNNCYYVKELPFLHVFKISIDPLNSMKSSIRNYIRNHYIHNDYHIVWEYYGRDWNYRVCTVEKKWHSYEYKKSYEVFDIFFNSKIINLVFNKKCTVSNKLDIPPVNKFICQILDRKDYISKYFKLDNIPTTLNELYDNLSDISQKTYDIIIENYYTNLVITESIIRTAKLGYMTNFIDLELDDYIKNGTNDIHTRKIVTFSPKKQHDDITLYFLVKYISYIFGETINKNYFKSSIISIIEARNSLHLMNMIDLN